MPEEVATQEQEEKESEITVEVAPETGPPGKPQLSDEEVAKYDEQPPEDEVSKYAKDAQKRIKSLLLSNQEWRRRSVQSQKDLATATDLASRLYQDNQNLKQNVQRSESALIEQALQRTEAQLQYAKNRLYAAVQSQRPEEIVAANEEMARFVAEKDRLQLLKPAAPEAGKDNEPPPPAQPQQEEASPATKAWVAQNPWFTRNPEMHAYALTVHHALAAQGIGEQNGDRYWGVIDQEIRKRYPEQFGMKAPEPHEPKEAPKESGGRPVTVTGATRTNGAPAQQQRSGRHVVLTESQVRIANTLGITPEDYARELIKQEQAAAKGTVQ